MIGVACCPRTANNHAPRQLAKSIYQITKQAHMIDFTYSDLTAPTSVILAKLTKNNNLSNQSSTWEYCTRRADRGRITIKSDLCQIDQV